MLLRVDARPIMGVAVLMALAVFSTPAGAAAPAASTKVSTPDVVVTATSFRCIRNMTAVRDFYVDNLLGNVAATVAVAQSPTGGIYPPGSLVQVNPSLAMVKHLPGRNPDTNDWEFVELDLTAAGATILGRGFADLNMRSGPNCFNCHKAAKHLGYGLREDPRLQFDPAHARHAPRPSEYRPTLSDDQTAARSS